jgi:pyruvate dehydrogenase E1 component
MYGSEPDDVFYYLTLYNENFSQPPRPAGVEQGIVDGIYRFADAPDGTSNDVAILFSGTANLPARDAASELSQHYGVGAELWSVTSYKMLREEALSVERWNRLHPNAPPQTPQLTRTLAAVDGPIVAVTDFMTLVPDQVAKWVPGGLTTLGTDGFGRSDSRGALRRFFEIDTGTIVATVLTELAKQGLVPITMVQDAFDRYQIDPTTIDPAKAHQ